MINPAIDTLHKTLNIMVTAAMICLPEILNEIRHFQADPKTIKTETAWCRRA